MSLRLKERDKSLFQSCVRALKNENKGKATICANEVAEVKRLIKFLHDVELAIERVILRMETMRELSEIIIDLKPALRMLRGVSKELFEVLPDVSSELRTVNDVISETLYSTRITTDGSTLPVNKTTPGGERILEEVSGFLEEKVAEKLPEPPATLEIQEETPVKQMVALAASCSQTVSEETVETENFSSKNLLSFKEAEVQKVSLEVEDRSLENDLLEYVKKRKGEIDLIQCSADLKASCHEIEEALDSLDDKGKIVIETITR